MSEPSASLAPPRRSALDKYGHVVSGPAGLCAWDVCRAPLTYPEPGAWMFTDLDRDKIVLVCETCARVLELEHGERFRLVML